MDSGFTLLNGLSKFTSLSTVSKMMGLTALPGWAQVVVGCVLAVGAVVLAISLFNALMMVTRHTFTSTRDLIPVFSTALARAIMTVVVFLGQTLFVFVLLPATAPFRIVFARMRKGV